MPHVLTVSVNFENFYCTTAFIGVIEAKIDQKCTKNAKLIKAVCVGAVCQSTLLEC